MERKLNKPYSTTASSSTILEGVFGDGAPIEGRGSLGEAQAAQSSTEQQRMRRTAMHLIGSERDRRKALWKEVLAYAKDSAEWSRTLTAPEADRWQGRIEGYGDRVNSLGAAPFIDATVAEFAANLARGCAKFSLLPSQQRRRAYLGAAKKRRKRRKELDAVLQHHAEGVSWRKIAALTGVPMRTARRWVVTANGTPLASPILTASGTLLETPICTANGTPDRAIDRAISRPSDPEHNSTTNNEVGTGPPLKVASGPVHAEPEREGAAQTDKAGGCGRGQPSHGAPAPAGATSHPLVTLPTETEPASGSATDGEPEPKGPKVGERVAVVDVLRAVAAAKAGTRLPSERCPLLPDPDVVARDDARRELFRRQAASRGVVIPEVGNDG